MTVAWPPVFNRLRRFIADDAIKPSNFQSLDAGQRALLAWIANLLPTGCVVLADEVGAGKTRIACAVAHAVVEAGGRAAIVVPHGLMHQWQTDARALEMPAAKTFTTMWDFIGAAQSRPWDEITPAPDEAEWLLISHGFRTPQVRNGENPAEWRVALPSYVRALLTDENTRNDARTHAGSLLTEPHRETLKIANQLIKGMNRHRRNALRDRLEELPWFRRGGDNSELIYALRHEGRCILEDLLGRWLGGFDLIVIDEAHKSRGDAEFGKEALAKGLPRLIDRLLKQPEGGLRLCLTATPMELDLTQWLDLLRRARSSLDCTVGSTAITRLREAAKSAAVAPDEGLRIDELCEAARKFTKTLSHHVTRRRRSQDPLVRQFRERTGAAEEIPHPHRQITRVPIGWPQTGGQNSPWIDALLAAEGLSRSARGLKLKDTATWPHSLRDAYTKLSAGHVSIDLVEEKEKISVPEPGEVDDRTRGKIMRAAYWHRRLRDARARIGKESPPTDDADFDPNADHPRILEAVREIESWTLEGEKVLVFGVFLGPLRLLRDVLNVRNALRAADAGRPIAHVIHTNRSLLGIALRHFDRLRDQGVFQGCLRACDQTELRRALEEGHRVYERLRQNARERAKGLVNGWRFSDRSMLGGAPTDRQLQTELADHLSTFIVDEILATDSGSTRVSQQRYQEFAAEFFRERLRPLLGEEDGADLDEDQIETRRNALRELVNDEEGPRSFHARLLQGATGWATRRYVQAAFNRRKASPEVLIAQSQVGREGLNLHESCRVVVQFHAEWNPAVLEQQIGRVDRKGSLWEKEARRWLNANASGKPPFIEVRQLVFEGTYDAFQWDRVTRRQHVFDASLFGSLLPPEAWEGVPEERRIDLRKAAPSFEPPVPEYSEARQG